MATSTIPASPIYYGYDGSPFVSKLETIFKLKNIPARRVDVPLTPPRTDILALGVPYRRVPILALGRDIYIDTALIGETLDKFYHATPLLATGTTIQKTVSKFYVDHFLFGVGFGLLPWSKTPKELQEDRKRFVGRDIDFEQMAKLTDATNSTLASHLTLLEEQLSDGRVWFFGTPEPGFVDASLYAFLAWARSFRRSRPTFDAKVFPKTVAWLGRLDTLIASKPALAKISGADAVKEIFSSLYISDIAAVGFDEIEAKRLGLKKGDKITVVPVDSGKDVDTPGVIIALSRNEVIIETEDQSGKGGPLSLRVHFPRLGYSVNKVGGAAKL